MARLPAPRKCLTCGNPPTGGYGLCLACRYYFGKSGILVGEREANKGKTCKHCGARPAYALGLCRGCYPVHHGLTRPPHKKQIKLKGKHNGKKRRSSKRAAAVVNSK